MRISLLVAVLCLAASSVIARAEPVRVVAAENVYGDIAQQIAGPDATVTSILTNPDQDPHLFEASPSIARSLAGARIVVLNGIDYDPWMTKLIAATRAPGQAIVNAGALTGHKSGDNPHLWYDPSVALAVAEALATELVRADPAHAADTRGRLDAFRGSIAPIRSRVAALRERFHGQSVTATEPVFGFMFDALGLVSRNAAFQRAVMNDTEPSASAVAAFERDLKTHAVRLLLYNSQASNPVAARMRDLAKASGIPVVGAAETEPPGMRYQDWMMSELDAVEHALAP